jgi:hypothetical protein
VATETCGGQADRTLMNKRKWTRTVNDMPAVAPIDGGFNDPAPVHHEPSTFDGFHGGESGGGGGSASWDSGSSDSGTNSSDGGSADGGGGSSD